ncbi:MAG: M28 family peptidase [Lentisphaerae bacterium]|nr:M28 family peptidase [Lentisphaerota bacterium]
MSSTNTAYSLGNQILGAVIFAALGLIALAGYVLFALPPEREHRETLPPTYSEQPLLNALTSNGLSQRMQAIERAGQSPGGRQIGRYSGSPGFYRTEQLIRESFRQAALEIQTQELPVTVPVTEYCEVLDERGQPIPGVTLYPFAPCGLIPTALPTNGIKGELVLVENSNLRFLAGHRPEESIVLTYLGHCDWKSLAALGAKAVIVMEDELKRSLAADPDKPMDWKTMVSGVEVVYPRFLARGPLEACAGKQVTLRCKVTWQEKQVRNLLGVLKGKGTAAEALLISAYYDSNSLVPELAPGAEQAIPLAVLLELAQALAPYRGQLQRDVIFIATAGQAQSLAGMCRLLEPIETFTVGTANRRALEDTLAEENILLAHARRGLELVNDDARWAVGPRSMRAEDNRHTITASSFTERWRGENADFREWLEKRVMAVLGEINLDFKDRVIERQLAYLRAGSPVYREGFVPEKATDQERKAPENRHPLLAELLAAKADDNHSGNLLMLPFDQLVAQPEFAAWDVRNRLRVLLEHLADYHRRQIKEIEDSIAIRELFAPYRLTMAVNPELNSGGARAYQDLAVLTGVGNIGSIAEPQVGEIAQLLKNMVPARGRHSAFDVIHWGARDAQGATERQNVNFLSMFLMNSELWTLAGKLAFTLQNYQFKPEKICTPEDAFSGLNLDVVREQVPVIARALLAMADGRVAFKAIPPDRKKRIVTLHGKVFGTAGAGTTAPNHPMGINTVVRAYLPGDKLAETIDSTCRGVSIYPVLITNPNGEYRKRFNFNLISYGGWISSIALDAARFDEQGRVRFFKNAAQNVQQIYPNELFNAAMLQSANWAPAKPILAGLFRCAGVELYEQNNPMTMQAFKGIAFLNQRGLASAANCRFTKTIAFLEPDWSFYLALLDGASDNKEILENRAFLLNVNPAEPVTPGEPEIYGAGYLAADNPNITYVHQATADSMLRTNEKRLELQKRYGIADELMLTFQARGKELLDKARQCRAAKDPLGAVLAAGKSLAYAMNNHPVIRKKISHAVIGILWYLGLLVPFVFFFEKLVFGFSDIRKQLLANGIIFMAVFLLLRWLHPAFQMVRSSLMILLGFVILLLTMLVTLMVSGKFKQNIKELRSKEGRIEGADINRGGVIGTAFMLGLNNMRRRKVRTGLTAVTLILLTFVIICFTSIATDLVDVEYPVGKSNWNGILFRKNNYLPLAASELSGLQQIYGQQYPLAAHTWLIASLQVVGGGSMQNAEIIVDREYVLGANTIKKRAVVNAAVGLAWNEPQFSGLDRLLLTKRGWFPREPSLRKELAAAVKAGYKHERLVILPDAVARALEITPEAVDGGKVEVTISGDKYTVHGIIDTLALDKVTGLDGRGIMPYDINSIQALGSSSAGVLVPEDVKRLNSAQVILVNTLPPGRLGLDESRIVSCGILFPREPYPINADGPLQPAVSYKEQRQWVAEFLERSGAYAYYAIDSLAYYGARQRARTFAGLLEMLIPLMIAALTVFSTMRSSVYERRDEIYVYNAVGIAPNHVFFMFMAEACVYAIVGAMLGYLLSQATGRALLALNLTGGLNMNYSSIETIYASLTIMGAVLLSTIIPARDAARLAAPAEEREWSVPVAEGDVMAFNLPFTFTPHDRIAVISYFHRWLEANGEGSAGPFFCAAPQPKLQQGATSEHGGGLLPGITTTVWLKPFDLGVSQRLDIRLPTDPQTGEYIANIRLLRLSGTSAAWNRTVKPFLGVLRKQFLNWRAATPAERAEMFTEARGLLAKCAVESAAA